MILPMKGVMHHLAQPNPDHEKCISKHFVFALFLLTLCTSKMEMEQESKVT